MKTLKILCCFLIFVACETKEAAEPLASEAQIVDYSYEQIADIQPLPKGLTYAWKNAIDSTQMLANQIGTPAGFERKAHDPGSFGEWLRFLPLKPNGAKVHYYNGGVKYADVHHRVIDMDVGKRDLQQCADAVMRLKAEYHFSKNEFEQIHFNFTSGDEVAFEDWAKGRKPIIKGNKVRFSPMVYETDYSYSNFKKYLISIFSYAGTASLSKEMNKQPITALKAGDVFIQGGFPGHAVIIVDVAVNAAGEKAFLLAQSYMPAQEMHILKNPNSENDSPWYIITGNDVETPEWNFVANDLKYFKN